MSDKPLNLMRADLLRKAPKTAQKPEKPGKRPAEADLPLPPEPVKVKAKVKAKPAPKEG